MVDETKLPAESDLSKSDLPDKVTNATPTSAEVCLERKDQLAHAVSQAQPASKDSPVVRVLRAPLALQDDQERQAQLAHQAAEVHEVLTANQAETASTVSQVDQVLEVRTVKTVPRAQLAQQVTQVQMV